VTVMYAGRIVEAGSSAQVLGFPRHPYTAALLRALPHPSRPDVPLAPIPGRAVPASLRPAGCAFAPRCTYSEDRCHSITPPLVGEPSGHAWACYVDPLGRS
jgi:oligopeptide/dipeptide ABC transporter ATP-binding protein